MLRTVEQPRPSASAIAAELFGLTRAEARLCDALQAGKTPKETAEAFGAGYAPKGIMRGRFAIPLRDREGTLIAYCGRTVKDVDLSQRLSAGEPDLRRRTG